MLSSLWRTLIHRQFGQSSQGNRRGKSPGKRRPRLQVEPLEDRCLLASHIDSFTLDASSVSEGALVTAFGSFTVDPEPVSAANNYFVRWGDGSTQDGGVSFGPGTFPIGPFTHRYLDDTGPGPTTDFTVMAAVFCCGATVGGDFSSRSVTVNNVPPTLGDVSATPIDENGTTTLSGTISDPGTLDTFRLAINWHDGTTLQTIDLPAGATSFSATHQYLDDDPTSTASDDIPIDLTLTDKDGGEATGHTTVTVNNVAPTLSQVMVTSPIDENGTATLTGTITDPGTRDTFRLGINWHDGTTLQTVDLPAGSTSFSVTHQYLDDDPTDTPSDDIPIDLTLTDDDKGEATATTTVTVNKVSPILSNVGVTSPIDENDTATLTGNITDPGTRDTFFLGVKWRETMAPEIFPLPAGSTSFSVTHQYLDDNPSFTPSDRYKIQLVLLDDDQGDAEASTFITVKNVAPTLSNVSATPIDEDDLTTLTGTITDPGTQDFYDLTIDWHDGSSLQTINLPGPGPHPFRVTHRYEDDNPSGTSTDDIPIDLSLIDDDMIDDDTGKATAHIFVTVANVPPTLSDVAATPINENFTTFLTGTITDPGTQDTFQLQINWHDGTPIQTINLPAGSDSFTVIHQYLDDDPTATPSDNIPIDITLTDDDTGEATAHTTVTVSNIPPQLGNLAATPIDENGITTLTGTISDPGTLDTFHMQINWHDGMLQDIDLPAGTVAFTATHQYLDDDPTGTPSDSVPIDVTLVDDDTGLATAHTTVTVNNVAPTLTNVMVTSPINEDDSATLTGTITDPGTRDTFRLRINWHDGTTLQTVDLPAGANSFTVTHQYLDDNPTGTPSDQFTIDLTLTDDDQGEATATTTITVNNVDPKLTALAATSVDENGVTHLTGTIVDPGTLDTFTLAVVWGDATDVDIVHLGTSHTFDLTHRYLDDDPSRTASDTDSIFVILQDDDFGSDTANIDVTISNVAPKLSDVRVLTLDGDRNFLDEGSRGFLFGDITDPGTLDTFTLVVDWGDGSAVETVAYEAGTTRITLPHTYADDNPSGTASDLYTVHVTLTDDDTGSDTASFQVQVNNVAPTITALTTTTTPEFPHTVDENQMFTLDGTFTDPGKLDTYRLLINWGDRSLPETFDLAAGATEFHIPHKYLDDTPTATPIDDYDISATLIDDDKGVISKSTRIIVFNVSPMLNNVGASASVAENGVAIVFANIIDPGTLDTFTLEVDWDDGTPRETFTYAAGTTTFLEHHQYLDDNPTGTPQDTRTIGLVLNDDDGGPPDMVLVDCVVRNVAPKLENVQVTSPVDENGNVTLTGDIVDPGTADTFTVQVDWGDGTEVETFENGNRRTFRHTHRYPHGLPGASSGKYSLVVTVTDDDTGQGFAAPEVTVAVGNTSAPHVVEVAVRGSSWGAPAYSIPIGSAAQLRSLPWINLDQVSIRFSEDVAIAAGALVLHGVSVPTYAISGFRYDPTTHTATWSLATPLGKDQVLIELGSGMFELGVNVLPGDVNGDGRVTSADARRVRAALRSHHYFVFADVDGNGRVKPADERAVTRRVRRLRLGNGLPSRKRRTIGRVT